MKRSTERILTTHAGRLPNPDNIVAIQQARASGDQATFDRLVKAGVTDSVRKQMGLRNDIHSDGEFWKARDEQYYNSRVTGVEMQPLQPGEWPSILGACPRISLISSLHRSLAYQLYAGGDATLVASPWLCNAIAAPEGRARSRGMPSEGAHTAKSARSTSP